MSRRRPPSRRRGRALDCGDSGAARRAASAPGSPANVGRQVLDEVDLVDVAARDRRRGRARPRRRSRAALQVRCQGPNRERSSSPCVVMIDNILLAPDGAGGERKRARLGRRRRVRGGGSSRTARSRGRGRRRAPRLPGRRSRARAAMPRSRSNAPSASWISIASRPPVTRRALRDGARSPSGLRATARPSSCVETAGATLPSV